MQLRSDDNRTKAIRIKMTDNKKLILNIWDTEKGIIVEGTSTNRGHMTFPNIIKGVSIDEVIEGMVKRGFEVIAGFEYMERKEAN